jgi:hypothetical protein
MLMQGAAGPLPGARQVGGNPTAPAGSFGELYVSELNPVYYSLLKAGRVYALAIAGANPAAFTGGAAGTPLLSLYNPAASGVDLVLLQARLAIRTTGSAAVATDFNFWAANQGGVAVTGTQTAARNLYSQANTGSAAYGMANTANTGALASSLIAPSVSIGLTAATAVTNVGLFTDEVKGLIVVSPGAYLAWGASVAPTGAAMDGALIWAEIPA